MGRYEEAIIKTLCYAGVFKYPLTRAQVWKFLIWLEKSKPQFSSFISTVDNLLAVKKIRKIKELLIVKNNYSWVKRREKEERISKSKIIIAQKVSRLLSFIPTIELIGLSGKLSMERGEKDDDIDLFFIVQNQTLWVTRLLITSFLTFLGFRRSPNDTVIANKMCINMIIDTGNLALPVNERDLFSAHEVVQMKPLYSKNNAFAKFISKNKWVQQFLPNSIGENILSFRDNERTSRRGRILSLFNNLAYNLQLRYMEPRKTTEIVRSGYVRFHPNDARKWVLPEYNKLIKSLKH